MTQFHRLIMSLSIKGKKRNHKRFYPRRPVSSPILPEKKSLEKKRKTASKDKLKKFKAKKIFNEIQQAELKRIHREKSHKKLSIQFNEGIERQKKSTVLNSQATKTVNNPYFPEEQRKSGNIQSSCLLSTHSQEEVGIKLTIKKHPSLSKTLKKQQSKTTLSKSQTADSLHQYYVRTKQVLEGYRKRVSFLEKQNLQLSEEVSRVKNQD